MFTTTHLPSTSLHHPNTTTGVLSLRHHHHRSLSPTAHNHPTCHPPSTAQETTTEGTPSPAQDHRNTPSPAHHHNLSEKTTDLPPYFIIFATNVSQILLSKTGFYLVHQFLGFLPDPFVPPSIFRGFTFVII
jgi:hypothetical protein